MRRTRRNSAYRARRPIKDEHRVNSLLIPNPPFRYRPLPASAAGRPCAHSGRSTDRRGVSKSDVQLEVVPKGKPVSVLDFPRASCASPQRRALPGTIA